MKIICSLFQLSTSDLKCIIILVTKSNIWKIQQLILSNIQRDGFYNLLLLFTQTRIKIIKYYTNQYAWIIIIQDEKDLQGNLLFRELVLNCFPQALLHPSLDHNPSYPGAGRPPPQDPGLCNNSTFNVAWVIRVAWVIYRIHI